MKSLLDIKVRGKYNGWTIQEGVLTVVNKVWCFCSNCPQMSDEYNNKKYVPNKTGYPYIWLFGYCHDAKEEESIVRCFSELKPIRKLNHEA